MNDIVASASHRTDPTTSGRRKSCKRRENVPKLCQGSIEGRDDVPNDRSAALPIYRFGGFTLDNHRGVLLSPDGQEIALRPKALQLLRLLVENAGEVIDRDRIMRSVWPEVTIGDDGITQCVRDIRRALGDEAQRIVRTLPKRGYILGVEVVHERAEVADAARTVQDKPSIAVLPFADLTADPAQTFFAEGIADDILTALSRNRGLTVIARGSSFAQRGLDPQAIASALSVRYVVQGNVRRDGARMRIGAQLIDAEGGRQIWGERYDRDLADLFAVQDDISSAVVAAVQPALADAEAQRVFRISPGEPRRMGGVSSRPVAHGEREPARNERGAYTAGARGGARSDVCAGARGHGGHVDACGVRLRDPSAERVSGTRPALGPPGGRARSVGCRRTGDPGLGSLGDPWHLAGTL